jgi:L-arabinose isomerase
LSVTKTALSLWILTTYQKLEIMQESKKGSFTEYVAMTYNRGEKTVHDTQKNKGKLINYTCSCKSSRLSK